MKIRKLSGKEVVRHRLLVSNRHIPVHSLQIERLSRSVRSHVAFAWASPVANRKPKKF